ncbi:hypothetical protein B0H13DRAFT_2380134 [Mycena leptocephala]|nr:hypothetical protein B0H13DRAFT_2380134 [Mycena leptocephala]
MADYKTKARYAEKACEASERYRDKKAEEERAANAAERLLRQKITLKPKAKPQHRGDSRPTTTTKPKTRPDREVPVAPLPTAAAKVKLREGRTRRYLDNNEEAPSDDSSSEHHGRRRSESPIFPGHTKPRTVVPPPCLECGEGGCPGCTCMCMESLVWIEHEGGHFFPTCKKCSGDECPGCACTCPQGTDWIEHGGHRAT